MDHAYPSGTQAVRSTINRKWCHVRLHSKTEAGVLLVFYSIQNTDTAAHRHSHQEVTSLPVSALEASPLGTYMKEPHWLWLTERGIYIEYSPNMLGHHVGQYSSLNCPIIIILKFYVHIKCIMINYKQTHRYY